MDSNVEMATPTKVCLRPIPVENDSKFENQPVNDEPTDGVEPFSGQKWRHIISMFWNEILRSHFVPTERQFLYSLKRDHKSASKYIFNLGIFSPSFHNNLIVQKLAEWGEAELVQELLNYSSVDPHVAIRGACRRDQAIVLKVLIRHIKRRPHKSLVRWCSENNRVDSLRVLLSDRRVNPNVDDHYCFLVAAKSGFTRVVQLFCDMQHIHPIPCRTKVDAAQWAIIHGDLDILKMLLPDIRPNFYQNYAIRNACLYGHTRMVKYLLQFSDVDPMDKDGFAVRFAVMNGYIKIVKLLFKHRPGINPSFRGNVLLRLAAKYGRKRIVDILLKHPKTTYSRFEDVIYNCCKYGNLEMLIKCLEKTELTEPILESCIFCCCKYGNTQVVEYFVGEKLVPPSEDCFNICKEKNRSTLLEFLESSLLSTGAKLPRYHTSIRDSITRGKSKIERDEFISTDLIGDDSMKVKCLCFT